jgi:hypothetical protein
MANRTLLALDVGHGHMVAVQAVADRGRVERVRVLRAPLPAGADGEATPEERGRHVRAALDAAGIAASTAIWTLPRGRVVFKRIELPGAEPHELPAMVRLAVQGETSLATDAAVDFVPTGPRGGPCAVWAVAAPQQEVEAIRRMAAAAGLGVARVAPRTCGTAALVSAAGAGEGACTIAFDLGDESTELVAVDAHGLRATRGTALAESTAAASVAVTEARRSWMALRMAHPDLAPARAHVLGAEGVATELIAALARELPITRLVAHPDVALSAAPAGADPGSAWPLVGLVLEEARRSARLDLANPRRAGDAAARRRLRVYAAVAVVAAAYCVGWLFGGKDRAALETRRADLVAKADGAREEHLRFQRDELKARHLDAWIASQPQWLDAMLHLHSFAPDPARVVLEGWSGQVDDVEVVANRDGTFALPPGVRIALDVETTDRAAADALREALIARREWTVRSTSSEGKAGRRLPVAVQLLLLASAGTPRGGATLEAPRGADGGATP